MKINMKEYLTVKYKKTFLEDVKSTEMNKFIKKYSEFKMQIHEKLQIGTIKCLMLKQILILKGNF